MSVSSNVALLLTATIEPNSILTERANTQVRRTDYLEAIKYYGNNFKGTTYFLENSRYELDDEFLGELNKYNVQLLRFTPSDQPQKGKGYQEFEMLDQALEQLKEKHDEFIKITGRYQLNNFSKIFSESASDIIIDAHAKMKVAITGAFKFITSVYDEIIRGAYLEADDSKGVFIEHVLYERLQGLNKERRSVLKYTPVYTGTSGSYNASLNRHPLKVKARNAERKLMRMSGKVEFKIEY